MQTVCTQFSSLVLTCPPVGVVHVMHAGALLITTVCFVIATDPVWSLIILVLYRTGYYCMQSLLRMMMQHHG